MEEATRQIIATTALMYVAISISTSPKLLSLLLVCLAQMGFVRARMEAWMVMRVIGHQPTGPLRMLSVLFTQMAHGVGMPPEMPMSPTLFITWLYQALIKEHLRSLLQISCYSR